MQCNGEHRVEQSICVLVLLMIHWDTAASRQRIHLCIRWAVRHQTDNKQALQGLQEALRGSVAHSVSVAPLTGRSVVTAPELPGERVRRIKY